MSCRDNDFERARDLRKRKIKVRDEEDEFAFAEEIIRRQP